MSQKKEYQKLLIDLYKENQSFLNKAIFSVSILAIPFLFEVLSKKSDYLPASILLGISLFGFCGVIVLQISSLKIARDGCEKSLEDKQESQKDGEKLFDKARKRDIWKEWFFAFSLILTASALIIKTLN